MKKAKNKKGDGNNHEPSNLISVPLPQPFLHLSPTSKAPREEPAMRRVLVLPSRSTLFLFFLFLFLFPLVGMLTLTSHLDTTPCPSTASSSSSKPITTNTATLSSSSSSRRSLTQQQQLEQQQPKEEVEQEEEQEGHFWRQPGNMGYRPCVDFSEEYRKETDVIMRDRRKYLLVVVSGGLNQQRNQIVDAVVIARILGAALVAPILQVNIIWGDESEFSDIFDVVHFKKALAEDVRVVSSLPSTHVRTRPVERRTPLHASASWIRSNYLKKLNREGVLLLRGLDSRLSKDLPPDLQKLRCKVAFHALRFSAPILELGNKLAMRMRSKGPYLALHLRLERDVWVRTGCLPGLGHEYNTIIHEERKRRPELLTARTKMSYHKRKLAGLCPLTSVEVARFLKALGAPRYARIYWAGGEPFGGPSALKPLTREFPYLYNKFSISLPGELEPSANKSSILAAIDYIVAEKSDVFMPSHGGNMGRTIRGHRAYAGHKKYITPNKRQMIPYFLNTSISEAELSRIVKHLHAGSLGQPEIRMDGGGKDVTAFPIPECMCNRSTIPTA